MKLNENLLLGITYTVLSIIIIAGAMSVQINDGVFMGFLGNFLGGVLTLAGVLITILVQGKESEKTDKQFEEQLKLEKEKINRYIESQQKAFITIKPMSGAIDFSGQIKMGDEMKILCDSNFLLQRRYIYWCVTEFIKNKLLTTKNKKICTEEYIINILRKTKAKYFKIENNGPGYAFDIFWKLVNDDDVLIRCGKLDILPINDKIYLPVSFLEFDNNINLTVWYKDAAEYYRMSQWHHGIFKKETEISKDEYDREEIAMLGQKILSENKHETIYSNKTISCAINTTKDCPLDETFGNIIFQDVFKILSRNDCFINDKPIGDWMMDNEFIVSYETVDSLSTTELVGNIINNIKNEIDEKK